MLSERSTKLEVWGDPIAHSKSPAIHAAAYAALGLDWSYGRRQVDGSSFAGALWALDDTWRGLSLTYPLKTAAFAAAVQRDPRAELTRAVNTLLLTSDGPHGFNTDVDGIVRSLADEGVSSASRARIIGAGATGSSAIVALAELGTTAIEIVARRPEAVRPLRELAENLGMTVAEASFDAVTFSSVDVTIATLPGDAPVSDAATLALAEPGGLLLDVVYGTWPTRLAVAWQDAGHPATSGLGMLLHQALVQVRIFAHGDPAVAVDDEVRVLAAMRQAVVGD